MYNFQPGIVVIDNFYEQPLDVREKALNCEYLAEKHDTTFKFGNAPWPGRTSADSYSPKNLDLHISKLFGKQLRQQTGLNSGRFRISHEFDTTGNIVHSDSCDYAGVLYLNNDVYNMPGTIFYTHKETNLDTANQELLKKIIPNGEFNDTKYWHINFVSYIVFNRLIVYPANKFHGIGPLFGTDTESARLVQLFFWDEI